METKPEVCWQVPVRREWEDLGDEKPDARRSPSSAALPGVRAAPTCRGGARRPPWLTRPGPMPVVATYASELRELIGDAAYDVLRDHCDAPPVRGGPVAAAVPLTEV